MVSSIWCFDKSRKVIFGKLIEQKEELIKELRTHPSGWDYAERIRGVIPGLNHQSMKWMQRLINQALDA